MNPANVPQHVFISYSRANSDFAQQLADDLRNEGVDVWMDDKGLTPGTRDWESTIRDAIDVSFAILLVATPDSRKSVHVKGELNVAQARGIPIYPIWAAGDSWVDCIPLGMSNTQYVDFRQSNYSTGLVNIMKVLRAILRDDKTNPDKSGGPRLRNQILGDADELRKNRLFPRPLSIGFVTRHDDKGRNIVERLIHELAPEKNNFVVLWGPGGAGKTALAYEVWRKLRDEFSQRITWTSAERVADLTLSTLLDKIAVQLGQEDLSKLAPDEKKLEVSNLVSSQPTLVGLDNFETVEPKAQVECIIFLEHAKCSVLITTRFHISRDTVTTIPIKAMRDVEAREFLHRLIEQTDNPSKFDNLDYDKIIKRAEANPQLLIWLVNQMYFGSVERTLSELEQGEVEKAEEIFNRSFSLEQVGDDGRRVLLTLSLFIDASHEALADVAGFGGDLVRLHKAIINLAKAWLVDTTEERERFGIQGLTRDLTRLRLMKDDQADEFRSRFVEHFLRYAQAHAAPTPENFDKLEAEKDNLLIAVKLAADLERWEDVIEIINALELDGVRGFLSTRGYWDDSLKLGEMFRSAARKLNRGDVEAQRIHNEAYARRNQGADAQDVRRLYDESFRLAERHKNRRLVALILHERAGFERSLGNLAEARRLYRRSLIIKKRIKDQNGVAYTLHELGLLERNQGNPGKARRYFLDSLNIVKELGESGDERSLASTSQELGWFEHAKGKGHYEMARQLYGKALEQKRRWSDWRGVAGLLRELGRLACDQHDYEEARRRLCESLKLSKKIGHKQSMIPAWQELGMLRWYQRKLAKAERHYKRSMKIAESLKYEDPAANSMHWLGQVAYAQGDLVKARDFFVKSLNIKEKNNEEWGIAYNNYQLGLLAEQEGHLDEAIQRLGRALRISEKHKLPILDNVRQDLKRLKSKI
jgi:tetratricopeptide (TPR) repeat protein